MPILKSAKTATGVLVGYHKIMKLEIDAIANTAEVIVNSHSDQDSALAGLPIAWQWRATMNISSLNFTSGITDGIENILISDETSPFYAGQISNQQTRDLSVLIAQAIAKTYVDVDFVVQDAVGRRTEEYKDAEADSRAYKTAGYVDPVPASVSCYAQHNPTGLVQTGQWAADDIILRADAFASAKLSMRENRFSNQSAMRTATTEDELNTAVTNWSQFIKGLRTNLQLPERS